jgi:hypothetical protein
VSFVNCEIKRVSAGRLRGGITSPQILKRNTMSNDKNFIATLSEQCRTSSNWRDGKTKEFAHDLRNAKASKRLLERAHADEPVRRRQAPPVHYDRAVLRFEELSSHPMNCPTIQPIKPKNGMGASGAKTERQCQSRDQESPGMDRTKLACRAWPEQRRCLAPHRRRRQPSREPARTAAR